jgi:allantoin racemase
MRILVVNPNTTSAMTGKIARVARAAAAAGTEIIAVNPPDGPASIEGYYDEAFSVPGLLAEIAKGEALGHRFSVVTTLSRSIAAIETNLLKYGLASRCAKVRACEVPVLALDDPASNASAQISAEIERCKREDNAEVIVLGCAGMAELAAHLSEQHGLPVLDGVVGAVKLAEAFGALDLKTSKIMTYAAPRPKTYLGCFAPFGPR